MLQFFKNALPIYVWCNSFVELITTDEFSHGGQTSENFRKQCETQILIPQEFEECFKNYSDKKIRHLHCLLWKYFLQYFNPQWRIQTAFFTPKNIWQISKERLLNSLSVMIRFSNLLKLWRRQASLQHYFTLIFSVKLTFSTPLREMKTPG